MELLTKGERIAARIMRTMEEQEVSCRELASRLGPSWNRERVMMRLGLLLPGTIGGRVPLTGSEIKQIAAALELPTRQLVTDKPAAAPPADELAKIRATWHETFEAEQAELVAL